MHVFPYYQIIGVPIPESIGGERIDTYDVKMLAVIREYTKICGFSPPACFFWQNLAFAKKQPIHFFILPGGWALTNPQSDDGQSPTSLNRVVGIGYRD
jgi:hypothetical protein